MDRKSIFLRGLVAYLVQQGVTSIRPRSPEDRKRFLALLNELNEAVAKASRENLRAYRSLVRLRNELLPSNTGALDGIETALRNMQLSLTSAPNPFYDEIAFDIPPAHAESVFGQLEQADRELISQVGRAYHAAAA
jgi:recombinational DNA repair ATPase RecF